MQKDKLTKDQIDRICFLLFTARRARSEVINGDYSLISIAERHGRTHGTINRAVWGVGGAQLLEDIKPDVEKRKRFLSLRSALSKQKIADIVGVKYQDVVWVLERCYPGTKIYPTEHPQHIVRRVVAEVRDAKDDDVSRHDIARKYKLTYRQVNKIYDRYSRRLGVKNA